MSGRQDMQATPRLRFGEGRRGTALAKAGSMILRAASGLLVLALVACSGSDDAAEPPEPTGGGAGGLGGAPVTPEVLEARAPDRTSVLVSLSALPSDLAAAGDPANYSLSHDGEALAIEQIAVDAAAGQITLTTAKQKLGVEYRLELTLPEVSDAEAGLTFLAADTTHLWVSDWSSPTYASLDVYAERVAVGEQAVIYVQEGVVPALDMQAIATLFDEAIHPVETSLFGGTNDIDGNGKAVLLVVEQDAIFKGFVNPADALSDKDAMLLYGVHSNEMEIVYLNAQKFTERTVAHELNHLIYRAQHVNPSGLWTYFKEGMAECAVHAVFGEHQYDADYFVADPEGTVVDGVSLLDFELSFEHYALSYLYFTYAASRLGGVDGYGELFAVDGNPADLDALLQGLLGQGLVEVMRDMWIATYVQAPSGPLGFDGMVDFKGKLPPAAASAAGLELTPTGAVLVQPWTNPIVYPGTQGPNIVYVGIDGSGLVDAEAPFETAGGVLLAFNESGVQSTVTEPVYAPASASAAAGSAIAPSDHPQAGCARIDRWFAESRRGR
jgi:hypothetical protein